MTTYAYRIAPTYSEARAVKAALQHYKKLYESKVAHLPPIRYYAWEGKHIVDYYEAVHVGDILRQIYGDTFIRRMLRTILGRMMIYRYRIILSDVDIASFKKALEHYAELCGSNAEERRIGRVLGRLYDDVKMASTYSGLRR
jgi:hypothetical protein